MQIPSIIIAVDGFSSTGKSTFAKLAAARLGFLYLDSGALYRAVTLALQEAGAIDSEDRVDPEALEQVLDGLDVRFRMEDGVSRTYLGTRLVEREIRSLAVSSQVSPVAALPRVRSFVDEKLREFGRRKSLVMDGRDIGTTVFPDAELKIFMTADAEVRARRRLAEMEAKGEHPAFEEVLANIRERDYIDSHRETSPLTQAPDAFVLDNSSLTLEEELAWVTGLIQGRFQMLQCPCTSK